MPSNARITRYKKVCWSEPVNIPHWWLVALLFAGQHAAIGETSPHSKHLFWTDQFVLGDKEKKSVEGWITRQIRQYALELPVSPEAAKDTTREE